MKINPNDTMRPFRVRLLVRAADPHANEFPCEIPICFDNVTAYNEEHARRQVLNYIYSQRTLAREVKVEPFVG